MFNDSGIFVFEVPSWFEMVKNYDFPDMVYHEHVYYFTLRAVVDLAKRVNMNICGFEYEWDDEEAGNESKSRSKFEDNIGSLDKEDVADLKNIDDD